MKLTGITKARKKKLKKLQKLFENLCTNAKFYGIIYSRGGDKHQPLKIQILKIRKANQIKIQK